MTLTIGGFDMDGNPTSRVIKGVANISRSRKCHQFTESVFTACISGDLSKIPQFDQTFYNSRQSMLNKVFGLDFYNLGSLFSCVLETEPIFGQIKWTYVFNAEKGWKYV